LASALCTLLARGYFPKELPPPFTTASFAAAVELGVPAGFNLLLSRPTKANPAYVTSPSIHNLARAGTLRRKLGIPNPVNQYQIAVEVLKGWKEISRHCRRSDVSLTTPRYQKKAPGRAIAPAYPFTQIPLSRAHVRAGCRYILSTDLNAFYPNVYTHAIPWALHGKTTAKARRTDYSLLGNRLDLAIRNSQSQQTIGIPIGPDTSLVIAEILASAVDLKLPSQMRASAFRYIDDFECGFMSSSDAESALAIVQNEFAEFELNLNPRKTKVSELPLYLEASWIPHLRLFPINGKRSQRTDLLGFFGRAFELARDQREEAILKYAIRRMHSVEINEENWSLYEDLLLGCLAVESGTTPAVVSELCRYRSSRPLNVDRITLAFDRLVKHHAPQHHGSEVAWSLWFMADSGYVVSRGAAELAMGIPDPVVGLCCLFAQSKGLVEAGVDWSPLKVLMQKDELLGPQWLLAYEASIKGWLPSFGSVDYIAAVPQFLHLRNHGVSFFDDNATLTVNLVKPPPETGVSDNSDFDGIDDDEDDDSEAEYDESFVGVSG
jgi:hypothetical protein